jgi:hypothetical protein
MQLAMPDFKYQIMDEPAQYVSGKGHRIVGFWHLASIQIDVVNGRYWMHNGHWLELALYASVVNDQ